MPARRVTEGAIGDGPRLGPVPRRGRARPAFDESAFVDGKPLDSLVMEARDRLANLGLFAAAAVVFGLALLVVQTRDPRSTRPPGTSARCCSGCRSASRPRSLFWLAVFARHRRIAYRGDWARAIRRGGWVVPRDRPLRRPPPQQGLLSRRSRLFILALVVVAEATLSVER